MDAQTLLFHYPAVAARSDYIRPVVKIELGARSHTEPSAELRSAWKQDYDAMRESMFFGEAPTFDDILTAVAAFERRFNVGGS